MTSSTQENKAVGVVISCYNYGEYLSEAIDSVFSQTYPAAKLVVVDDASTDDSQAVMRSYYDHRNYVPIAHSVNRGVGAARNTGVEACDDCELILPLDADDVFLPHCIETLVEAYTGGIVRAGMNVNFHSTPQHKSSHHFPVIPTLERKDFTYYPPPKGDTTKDFFGGNRAYACSLFPRKAWEEIGGYDESLIYGYEDWDLWMRILAAGYPIASVNKAVYFYRQHGPSLVKKAAARDEEITTYLRKKWVDMGISNV